MNLLAGLNVDGEEDDLALICLGGHVNTPGPAHSLVATDVAYQSSCSGPRSFHLLFVAPAIVRRIANLHPSAKIARRLMIVWRTV